MDLKRLVTPSPAALIALLIVAPAGRAPLEANDFFFHLAAGRWWIGRGAFPATDPFSPTASAQAPHEWVWGVLCELSLRLCGGAGPKLLVATLIVASFAVLWRLLAPKTDFSSGALRIALFGVALWTQSFTWYQERPFHLAHLTFGLWLLALEAFSSKPDSNLRFAGVVGVSALWANLHGSWVLGPVFLGVLLVAKLRERALATRWVALLVGCTLVAAIHPAGIQNLLYPVQHQFLTSTQNITEWAPLDFSFGFTWALVALVGVVLWRLARRDVHGDLSVALPALALTLAAFWSRRHAPFAGMALSVAAARLLEGPSPLAADRLLLVWTQRTSGFIWPVALLASLVMSAQQHPRTVRESIDESWYPLAGLDELTRRPPGRVLAKFEWGGLVSAMGGTGYQTFIDSRNDPYPQDIHDAYNEMRALKPTWKQRLAAFNPDYVLWGGVGRDFSWPLVWALEAEGWKRVAEDDVGVLLVKP